jgi:cytochrome c556
MCGLAVLALSMAGCGEPQRGSEPDQQRPTDRVDLEKSVPRTSPTPEPVKVERESLARTDEQGRRWIGDIPYDVWFEDPLSVLAADQPAEETRSPSQTDTVTEPTQRDSEPEQSVATPNLSTSGAKWENLIAAEQLRTETKSILNRLTTSMQSVATYNRSYEDIGVQAATLAAIAGIVASHSGSLRWKENAAHICDLATSIADAAQGRGRTSYQAVQIPFEALVAILSGDVPAGLEPASSDAEGIDFALHAECNSLMHRIESAHQHLKQNLGDRASFPVDAEEGLHEATLLAALVQVITTEGYNSSDEAEYAGHAQEVVRAAQEIIDAVKEKNYEAYGSALNRMQVECNECHTRFRFGGDE